jgi:hypothetical protein
MFDTLVTLALLTANSGPKPVENRVFAMESRVERVAMNRERGLVPPPEKPFVAKSHRSEVEPELATTCHLNRSGSCWSED